jgi:hypothetical protein
MGQFNRIEHLASTLSYLYDSDTKTSTFNGAPPVILAIDEATTKLFATTTREAFVGVTGTYTDFPDNSTTTLWASLMMCRFLSPSALRLSSFSTGSVRLVS